MITFKRAYVATIDGKEQVFASLRDAQVAELASLLPIDITQPWRTKIGELLIDQSAKFMGILTLSDSSRPKARGQKRPRKSNGTPAPELPLKEGDAA